MARAAFGKTAPARLCEQAHRPVYLLDRQGRISYANAALSRFLDTDLASLHGLRCEYSSSSASHGGGIAPPPAVWQGTVRTGNIYSRSSGNPPPLPAVFVPLLDAAGEVIAVWCLAAEIDGASEPDLSCDLDTLWHEALAAWRRGTDPWKLPALCVGKSPHALRLREQLHLASVSAARSVVIGADGSGREQLVRQIHTRRHPNDGPTLVSLVCPLLDDELLQSTIISLLQECAQLERETPPTLFLVDVDQLPSAAQKELRGYLAIDEFSLGTIATSRRSLLELASQERFDPELALLLSTLELPLPPLATRGEDLPMMVQALVEEWNQQSGVQRAGFTEEALEWLAAYPWPGDLEELQEVVRDCCRRAPQAAMAAGLLPARIRLGVDALTHPQRPRTALPLDQLLEQAERSAIEEALREKRQNRAAAARMLGVSRGRLLRRIAQLGIGETADPS